MSDTPSDPTEPTDPPTESPVEETAPAPRPRSGGGRAGWWVLLALLALAVAGYFGWQRLDPGPSPAAEPAVPAPHQHAELLAQLDQLGQQNARLSEDLQQLRSRNRALEQRLDDTAGTARIMREELLGIGERASMLEDALAQLARTRREGTQALRLDEIEFMLQLAVERLQLFGDVAAAERSLQIAAQSLASIDDPIFAGVRRTLDDELAMLQAVEADPRLELHRELGTLQRLLDDLPAPPKSTVGDEASRWQQVLGALVTVRRVDDSGTLLTPIERAGRIAALRLQLNLAQSALERADTGLWQGSLARAVEIFDGLFDPAAKSTALTRQRLQQLLETTPVRERPELGASLRELRNLRTTRRVAPAGTAPAPSARPAPAQATEPGEAATDLELERR